MVLNSVMSPHQSSQQFTANLMAPLFYLSCLITYSIAFFNPDNAVKCLTVSAVLSLYIIYKNISTLCTNKRLFIFPSLVLLFGIMQILWVFIFKQPGSPFTAAYRSYQNAGKVLILSSVILTALSACPPKHKTASLSQWFIIMLGMFVYLSLGYDLYQQPFTKLFHTRLSLPEQSPTGTAYSLTFLGLLVSQAIFKLRNKYTLPLFFIHLCLSCLVIVLTQTRAAILVYPILTIALFVLRFRDRRQVLKRSIIAMVALILAGLILLHPVLEKRFNQFESDISAYQDENSKTSVGARLAMQRAGFMAGEKHLFGQSLEQRSREIRQGALQDPSLKGAVAFLNVHMHNELIDTFSLKGLPGTLLLLLLYLAALFVSVIYRSGFFLIMSGAVMAYGLSDMVLYAKSETLMSMLSLASALMLLSKQIREE